jgi:hypothetical protein
MLLGIASLVLMTEACAPRPVETAAPVPERTGRAMVGANPKCEPGDSLHWIPTSFEEAAGDYALYVVSGHRWDKAVVPDSGRLVLITPDSAERARACGASAHCSVLPIGGTDIKMNVKGQVGWLPEIWRGDSRMQTLYVALDSIQGSVQVQMGGAFDIGVLFRGGFTNHTTLAGTWFSVVDEELVNRGLWCAIKLQ